MEDHKFVQVKAAVVFQCLNATIKEQEIAKSYFKMEGNCEEPRILL